MQKAAIDQIKVGSYVEILATENVTKRFPEFIGGLGIVDALPMPSGIWFSVLIQSTGQVVKIQQNAIKLVRKPANCETPVKIPKYMVSSGNSEENDANSRPRSNSSPSTNNQSIAFALKCGMKVGIIGTDNVVQRVPQYVGQIGIIKEAPVHPATWFKVQFSNMVVVTFRPSALRPVDDNGVPKVFAPTQKVSPGNKSPLPKEKSERKHSFDRSEAKHASLNLAAEVSASGEVIKAPSKTGKKQSALLSATDPDSWIGRRVQVLGGRYNGVVGTVVSSGNGWVQIDTDSGEVAKRAYELEIVAEQTLPVKKAPTVAAAPAVATSAAEASDDGGSAKANKTRPLRSRRAADLESEQTASTTTAEEQSVHTLPAPVPVAPQPTTSERSERSLRDRGDKGERVDRNASAEVQVKMRESRSVTVSDKPKAAAGNNNSSNDAEPVVNRRARANSDLAAKPPANNSSSASMSVPPKQTGKSADKPIRCSVFVDSKRSFIAKYVARHQAKNGNRPDLADWKYRIDAALYAQSDEFEWQAARLFDESHCEVCNLEKWPAAKFCWSENCPISPVYYKLTGAPAPAKRVTNHGSLATSQSVSRTASSMRLNEAGLSAFTPALPTSNNTATTSRFQDPFLSAASLKRERGVDLSGSTGENSDAGDRETVVSFDEGAVAAHFGTLLPPAKRSRADFRFEDSSFDCLSEVQPNPVTDFLLEAPAQLLSNVKFHSHAVNYSASAAMSARFHEYALSQQEASKDRTESFACSTDCETSPPSSSPVTSYVH